MLSSRLILGLENALGIEVRTRVRNVETPAHYGTSPFFRILISSRLIF
jgi:hypothetical protein